VIASFARGLPVRDVEAALALAPGVVPEPANGDDPAVRQVGSGHGDGYPDLDDLRVPMAEAVRC